VRARAIQDRPDLGVATALQLCEATQIADEQLISRVIDWPLTQEGGQSSGCRSKRVLQRGRGTTAHGGRGEIRGASREKSIQRTPCDEAPFEQERQPLPRPRDAELREHQRDIGIILRAKDAHRSIQRVLDEARHLRLVRHFESGIEIGFERKFTKKGQAERVDRADRDFSQTIPHVIPSHAIELGS
jgi:hypothetical protein